MSEHPVTLLGGKYEVLRELGSGGSAVVYLARDRVSEFDEGAGRLVALKVLREDGGPLTARDRFSQEIRVLAKLVHPNIVPLFDTGTWNGRPYFVMPYVDGESLADRIRRLGKLQVDEVLRIAHELCDALDYAHSLRIVHRDVKPSNVLITPNGRAMLSDFGVAQWMELTGDDRPTRSSAGTPGTVMYASPEQVAGDRHLDGRSDIFSLGCLLYEALTGELPFQADTSAQSMALRLSGPAPSPRKLRPEISTAVDECVRRALNPVIDGRWARAGDLSAALSSQVEEPLRRRYLRIAALPVLVISLAAAYAATSTTWRSGAPRTSATVSFGLRLIADSTNAQGNQDALAWVQQYLEIVPGLNIVTDNNSSQNGMSKQRYQIRIGAKADNEELAVQDIVSGTELAHYRRSTDSASHTSRTFFNQSSLGALKALSERDSLFPAAYRTSVMESQSAEAVRGLVQGWVRFGRGDLVGALAEFAAATKADPKSALAVARLASVHLFKHSYDSAYVVIQNSQQSGVASTGLTRGLRLLAERRADSAIAILQKTVNDNPFNVDGQLALAQALYFHGWAAGFAFTDARSSFRSLIMLDSGFVNIAGQLFDTELALGDKAGAQRALALMPPSEPWRQAKSDLMTLVWFADSESVLLARVGSGPRSAISELVLQLSRHLGRTALADTLAAYLVAPGRSPEDRTRGLGYLAVLGDSAHKSQALNALTAQIGRSDIDSWLAAADLAGLTSPAASRALRGRALQQIRSASNAELMSPLHAAASAFDYLVQRSLLDLDVNTLRILHSRALVVSAQANVTDPAPAGWVSLASAGLRLAQGDSVAAIQLLETAVRRIDTPYDAFFPLRAWPAARAQLARFAHAQNDRQVEQMWLRSFVNSWSIGDAFYDSIRVFSRK